MTQPCAALPVMQDKSNNAKGFTSRILWFFPEPVFATFDEGDLTDEEMDLVDKFQEDLGKLIKNITGPIFNTKSNLVNNNVEFSFKYSLKVFPVL